MAELVTEFDVAYGPAERNKLDIYLPEGEGPFPVVLFIHGGRWFRRDKAIVDEYEENQIVETVLDAGIALASMNHRYSTTNIWPAQLEDIYSAVDFLDTYPVLDMDNYVLWGQSSGAHLSLMGSLRAREGREPRAVLAFYAPSLLPVLHLDQGTGLGGTPEEILLGQNLTFYSVDAFEDVSPTYIVKTAESLSVDRFFLRHGVLDTVVPPVQTERLEAAVLSRDDIAALDCHYVEGAAHGRTGWGNQTGPAVQFVLDAFAAAAGAETQTTGEGDTTDDAAEDVLMDYGPFAAILLVVFALGLLLGRKRSKTTSAVKAQEKFERAEVMVSNPIAKVH